jgi:hypothetical protein
MRVLVALTRPQNPNQLEARANKLSSSLFRRVAWCYRTSRLVNFPANRVQQQYKNEHNAHLSVDELLQMWEQGLHIDVDSVLGFRDEVCHTNSRWTVARR